MTPEKRVQNTVISYLHKWQEQGYPVFVERRQAGSFNYRKGIPDLYAVVDGIHLEIEVKRPGGELSIMQQKFRDKCKQLHIKWCCASNIDDIEAEILLLLVKYL